MIKKSLTVIIALFLCVNMSAQIRKAGKVEFGVKGGINSSTASTHYKSNQHRMGYNAGVNFTYYLDDNYTINTGLEYISKGVIGRNDYSYPTTIEDATFNPDGRVKTNINLGYIQLPITIGYELIQSKNFSLDLRAGTYIAYGVNVSAKEHIKGEIIYDDGSAKSVDYSIKHTSWDWLDMHRVDWGAIVEMGLKIDKVSFNVAYDLGLLNIGNSRPNNSKYRYRLKNRTISATVGYNFISK